MPGPRAFWGLLAIVSLECDHHRNPLKPNLCTTLGPEARNDTDPMVTCSGMDSVYSRAGH